MAAGLRSAWHLIEFILHRLAFWSIVAFALAMLTATTLSATGVWPWLGVLLSFGDQVYENAGQLVQIGLTAFAVMMTAFLPASRRVMALENSHRAFSMGIEDVARAYHHAHAADRGAVFRLSPEFDAMRERLAYLRDHPDLGAMEPEILELAAQMSYLSRDLAETYSDDNVARARDFLRQRQEEVERFSERLKTAKVIHEELKHWLTNVELEESVAAAQLERLRDELYVIIPEILIEERRAARKVIDLPRAAE